nr:TetR/AcrR family transcriptional regulator [Pseudoflavonifractor phocaeensis]
MASAAGRQGGIIVEQTNVPECGSRAKIRESFLQLLSDKKLEAITVKDICGRANVSRGIFYIYYDSKYELLEEIERHLTDGFIEIMLELRSAGIYEFRDSVRHSNNVYFEKYFRYIRANETEFRALLCSKYQNGFSSRFARAIMKTRLETFRLWNYPTINSPVEMYREEVLSSLYVSLFTSWLNNGMNLSEMEMARLLVALWRPLSNFVSKPGGGLHGK